VNLALGDGRCHGFFEALPELQAKMVATGQVPRDIRSYLEEMINALRSR
jgi:hypothetical protein